MADQFLIKTRIAAEDLVEAGGRPVLERFADVYGLLTERAGPEVAALFAEPLLSHGNDAAAPTVSWYAPGLGEPRRFDALSAAERERIGEYLSDHLRPLRGLAGDPAVGELAWGALSTLGQDDIFVVGDKPVIVNWGLLPGGGGANVSSRPEHFAAALGRFLQPPARPPQPEPALPPDATAGVVPSEPDSRRRSVPPVAWVPLLVLLLLSGGVLWWLLQPGSRLLPRPEPQVTETGALSAQTALNRSLRDRIAALQTSLDGAVCRADGVLVLPSGLTPGGLTPPPPGTAFAAEVPAASESMLPNPPDRILVPAEGDERQDLAAYIAARTVLILAEPEPGGTVGSGSGFAIGPGLIVTNQHVIAGAARIWAAGGALAEPVMAELVATDGPLAETGADFALLRIPDADMPMFSLHRPDRPLTLSNIVAAGYPGDVLELDTEFAALLRGEAGAAPGLTITDGIINTEQSVGPRTSVLMHSAPLSSGNSGGPLIDMCGRVVGVNAFVRRGPLQNRSYALPVAALETFLSGAGAAADIQTELCAPLVAPRVAQSAPSQE